MGILFSKLLNKLGLLSDEDLAEELLEDAARDIKQAEASLDRVLASNKSDPEEYKAKVDKAYAGVIRVSARTDRLIQSIDSLDPNIILSIKNRRTMKKRSHRSPHRSHGGQTKKRVHRARYSRRAAR